MHHQPAARCSGIASASPIRLPVAPSIQADCPCTQRSRLPQRSSRAKRADTRPMASSTVAPKSQSLPASEHSGLTSVAVTEAIIGSAFSKAIIDAAAAWSRLPVGRPSPSPPPAADKTATMQERAASKTGGQHGCDGCNRWRAAFGSVSHRKRYPLPMTAATRRNVSRPSCQSWRISVSHLEAGIHSRPDLGEAPRFQ
eukprot:scaffold18716_cov128-Isochrysis_galbana.AAC.4